MACSQKMQGNISEEAVQYENVLRSVTLRFSSFRPDGSFRLYLSRSNCGPFTTDTQKDYS